MSRPLCKCGNLAKKNGKSKKSGKQLYNSYCRSCAKSRHGKKERVNRELKEDKCCRCGFVPEHRCQLDIDHRDGNKQNNDPSNIQTLCANCHRLKTWNNRDWLDKS